MEQQLSSAAFIFLRIVCSWWAELSAPETRDGGQDWTWMVQHPVWESAAGNPTAQTRLEITVQMPYCLFWIPNTDSFRVKNSTPILGEVCPTVRNHSELTDGLNQGNLHSNTILLPSINRYSQLWQIFFFLKLNPSFCIIVNQVCY